MSVVGGKDGVIGRPSLWIAEDFGCCASGWWWNEVRGHGLKHQKEKRSTGERRQVTVMFSDLVARGLLVPEGCTTAGRLAGLRSLLAVIGAGGGTKFPILAELMAIRSLFDAAIPSI